MAKERSLGKFGRYLVLATMVIAFIMIVSAEGYCDYGFTGGIKVNISLVRTITIDPTLAYEGQTITIRGSGFNTTPYPGDPDPIVFCNAYCFSNGTMKPIKVQSDGTFIVQPTPNAPGEADIYAVDRWGSKSNEVHLKVTYPVTFTVNIVDANSAPYVTNGVLCTRYPASAASHYEGTIIGSTYTQKMAFNGTSAELWVRQTPLTTDHKTITNIQEGKTYTVTLTMPVNTPVPTATPTGTPTQTAQATVSPTSMPSTLPGTPDSVAPETKLNLTGLKDASGIFTTNVVCTLTSVDTGSGVNDTTYSFDGANWTAYTGPFTITTPGNTTIFYRSTDKAGNVEVTKLESVALATNATAAAQSNGCGSVLVLPLLCAGVAGLYRMRKLK